VQQVETLLSGRRRLTGWLASVTPVAAVTALIKLVHPHGPALPIVGTGADGSERRT
jgi:D-mannonate dehydratase